jgi:uncharacterized protein
MSEDGPHIPGGNSLLEGAASSYLRSAQHQPVNWHPWGEEAFRRAQVEDKPILLDIGAVWCHWCHVMDRESYEDPEIAAIINQHFIAVKVDRDERPDVDARYQAAVSAVSGQGGWPLTAFLTPDGKPFFGGTYIPRHESYGRSGISQVLLTIAEVWRTRRQEAIDTASNLMAYLDQGVGGRAADQSGATALSLAVVNQIVDSALHRFDPVHGGFGTMPKFYHSAVLDLLLHKAASKGARKGEEQSGNGGDDREKMLRAFTVTLEKMAQGGVYDQLGGGFHRYSVDDRWVVPHFEKMLYDNTELLRNYVHGFQSVGREDFLLTALEIVSWLNECMTDRARGGFYASQDADIDLNDDGDYFTWTLEEAREVLTPSELDVAARHWDIEKTGEMHHDPARNVLYVRRTVEEMAGDISNTAVLSAAELDATLGMARRKMLAARMRRPTPFIDRTLYTGWNAMAVTAYFETAQVLRMEAAGEFAIQTLDRILKEAWDGNDTLLHVIAYGAAASGQQPDAQKPQGTLEDYAFTVHACIDAWSASGEISYYRTAVKLADAMIDRFFDKPTGAFNDTAVRASLPLGALGARRQPVEDAPTPAGNPVAAAALLRLEALSGQNEYRRIAEETLESFAAVAGQLGLYGGSYGLAAERLLLDPTQVLIVGSGTEANRMEKIALAGFAVNKTVLRIDPGQLLPYELPEALAETLLGVPRPAQDATWAIVCRHRTCLPPVSDAKSLIEVLRNGL